MKNLSALQQIDLNEMDLDHLLNPAAAESDSIIDQFRVTDLSQANWCLRKLQALTAKASEVNALADAEVARINDWRAKETESIASDIQFFEGLLARFHAAQLAADPKVKTITTPYGKLKSTTRKPSPKKVDDDALLQHLKDTGETDFIVVKETPAWGELKKTLTIDEATGLVYDQNGLPVTGVEIEAGGTTFKVEVDA